MIRGQVLECELLTRQYLLIYKILKGRQVIDLKTLDLDLPDCLPHSDQFSILVSCPLCAFFVNFTAQLISSSQTSYNSFLHLWSISQLVEKISLLLSHLQMVYLLRHRFRLRLCR